MSGDYVTALKAAGAEVHEFKEFGSYQGEWFALVTANGQRGWIQGSFGSCSGCDAFEAEFGWKCDPYCNDHLYDERKDCPACHAAREGYDQKLREFGRPYVEGMQTADEILKVLDDHASWDDESREAAQWIRSLEGRSEVRA